MSLNVLVIVEIYVHLFKITLFASGSEIPKGEQFHEEIEKYFHSGDDSFAGTPYRLPLNGSTSAPRPISLGA